MKIQITIALLAALLAVTYSLPIDDGKIEGEDFSLKEKLELAKKYAKLIETQGVKAWHFIECMGSDWAHHCVKETLGCVGAVSIPGCIELISCAGKSAKDCVGSFK